MEVTKKEKEKVNVKELIVTVTYTVMFEEIEMPKDVHEEIINAVDDGDKIIVHSLFYGNAQEWLTDNCKESDSMEWEAEIYDIITPEQKKPFEESKTN